MATECTPQTPTESVPPRGTRPGADGRSDLAMKYECIRKEQIFHHCKMQQAVAQLTRAMHFFLIVTTFLKSHHQSSYSTILWVSLEAILQKFKRKLAGFWIFILQNSSGFFCKETFFNGQYLHFQNNQPTFLPLFCQSDSIPAPGKRKSPILLPRISTPLTCIKGTSCGSTEMKRTRHHW